MSLVANSRSKIDPRDCQGISRGNFSKLQTTSSMSLNVNIRVPVTALDNEALQQTRRKVNKPPEAEEEDISCFLELLIAKKARDEEFDPAFLAGWLGAYNHWVSSSSIEPTPPVFYRYPIHREIGRGIITPSRGVCADQPSLRF